MNAHFFTTYTTAFLKLALLTEVCLTASAMVNGRLMLKSQDKVLRLKRIY